MNPDTMSPLDRYLRACFRVDLHTYLRIFSSTEFQHLYVKNVLGDDALPTFIEWWDESYTPIHPAFQLAFSLRERALLSTFHECYISTLKMMPDPSILTPNCIDHDPIWHRIVQAAQVAMKDLRWACAPTASTPMFLVVAEARPAFPDSGFAGAYVHAWMARDDRDEALSNAIDLIEGDAMSIVSIDQVRLRTAADVNEAEAKYFEQATIDGEVLVCYRWERDDDDGDEDDAEE